ncbi:RecF/RecN/SMC N terminal domain-containing protein [Amylostereum chailletii]|nr:RecF/RecN/SMC N terminal domain-containing protein [Amylostereum chailletii]
MPPRRSSRSARASAEPAPVERPVPAKRKRPQPAEDPDDSVKEQENVPKPSSRATRRAPSAPAPPPATRKASATRSGRTLPQVQEDEDEDEDGDELGESSRPVKKSRPSRDHEEEDVKPVIKPTRAASKAKAKSKPEVIVIDDSSDEEEAPPPKTRKPPSRRSSAAPPSRGTATRTSRAASRTIKADPVVEEAEDSEEIVELPRPSVANGSTRRSSRSTKPPASSSRSTRKASVVPMEVEEQEIQEEVSQEAEPKDEDVDEDHDAPRRRGKQRAPKISIDSVETPTTSAVPPPDPVPLPSGDVDDDLDYLNVPTRTPKREKGKGKAPASSQPFSGPEVEETSLLDAISASPRKSALPPPPEEPEAPKERLTIHKLALVNFKSYAGRQEIGPFHKSFSAIVGPNGSGKSNTIDALLFVFGYRASKMRQGKLSELIHNSAQYPDLDSCTVEVHFRDIVDLPGPDAYEVVPNSTLIVSRTAFKNNSSRYTINSRASNYKEVQSLLKGRGIDLDHNRFLILQGEVESISQMKPKAVSEHEEGLLEYLEDIIGTSSSRRTTTSSKPR